VFRLLLLWYVIMSLSTFAAYWLDKRAAERGRPRTRERTLHLLALGGGVPGAFAGMNLLKHKRRKRSFVIITWLILLLHAAGWTMLAVQGPI